MTRSPERFESGGARVYRIPLDLFPGLKGWAHLVFAGEVRALIDTGSGLGESNDQLETGLAAVAETFAEPAAWDRLTDVVITHGHIDHFGGLPFVRERSKAPVHVHRFDLRVLADYERRLDEMARRLRRFLIQAGPSDEEIEALLDMYRFTKNLYASQEIESTFDGVESQLGPMRVLHVPGHCPGQIVIEVGDLLLTSDHVLPSVTPHMAPASLARHTGLSTYLESLDRLEAWGRGAGPALGGHGPAMLDLHGRIDEIRAHHARRLEAVAAALRTPRTIAELAAELFPTAAGYHGLLALEEVGAHVEYLERHGRVRGEAAGAAERGIRYRLNAVAAGSHAGVSAHAATRR